MISGLSFLGRVPHSRGRCEGRTDESTVSEGDGLGPGLAPPSLASHICEITDSKTKMAADLPCVQPTAPSLVSCGWQPGSLGEKLSGILGNCLLS